MSAHARLSPSNHRWSHCPGSVREEAAYPDTSGEAAVDGTGSHLLLETCIEYDNANHMLDQTIGEGDPDKPQGWWVKQDRIDRVNVALRYIQMRRKELGPSSMQAESKSDPGSIFGRDDWSGTCDVTIIGNRVVEVIDYKDGRGYVSEKDNPQLNAYAGGKMKQYWFSGQDIPNLTDCGIDKIRMTIIQPKTKNPIRFEEIKPVELYERLKKLAIAAKATDDPDAPLIPGSHCQWCKHGRAGNCEAKNLEGMEGIKTMTDIVPTSVDGQSDFITAIQSGSLDLSKMDGKKLSSLMDVIKPVEKFCKMIKEEVNKRVEADPVSVPGYEMGKGRGKSEWIDEKDIVAKKLRAMRLPKDDVLIPTLITPAAALEHEALSERQKLNLEKLIRKVDGKPTVVKSKVQIVQAAEDMFMGVDKPVEALNFL